MAATEQAPAKDSRSHAKELTIADSNKLARRLRQAVAAAVGDGRFAGEPALADRLASYEPLVELAIIANDRKVPIALRARCHHEIARYLYAPRRVEGDEAGALGGKIVVVVAPWAGGAPAPSRVGRDSTAV